jgi:hypothetical protein
MYYSSKNEMHDQNIALSVEYARCGEAFNDYSFENQANTYMWLNEKEYRN